MSDTATSAGYMPRTQEITTFRHALRILGELDIKRIAIRNQIPIDSRIKRRGELVEYLNDIFQQGLLSKNIYNEFRQTAFNPEPNTTDGFFQSFDADLAKINIEELSEMAKKWNDMENKPVDGIIEININTDGRCVLTATRQIEKFAFDARSEVSTSYYDETQMSLEIDFNRKVIYYQTTNSVKFQTIKTLIRQFLIFIFEDKEIKLFSPRMSQTLTYTKIKEDNWSVEDYRVSPNTIKILDLLFELNQTTHFDDFECIEITFDHEDVQNQKKASKIHRQNYGGDNLLAIDVVKNLILSNRNILEVEFKLTYKEPLLDGNFKRHYITVGLINEKGYFLRIYIKNNEHNLKLVLARAYQDLKAIFIEHFSAKELRNEETIKITLGLL
ncbi:hypothetical protein [Brevibacillus porteri]|uniref:hypothetical protein n=1 Tax=Brevibacillus porteri TaxID=2126350 RepID=UPI003D1A9B01